MVTTAQHLSIHAVTLKNIHTVTDWHNIRLAYTALDTMYAYSF